MEKSLGKPNMAMDNNNEKFSELLEESFSNINSIEGSVVSGKVITVEKDVITVDIGLKSEGRISKREFGHDGESSKIKEGDEVEVYIERLEDINGQLLLSREKARREEAWVALEKSHEAQEIVTGIILGRVKGGFTVDIDGATAFLPGSQVDIKPIKDFKSIMNIPQNFQILKMDRRRGNIVISRRAVLEENRAEARSELVSKGISILMRLFGLENPVVVASSGHAVALGGFLMLVGDYRIGVQGDYKIGLNETAIGLSLPMFGLELVKNRLNSRYVTRSAINAELFSPNQAVEAGFLDAVVAEESLLEEANLVAKQLNALDRTAFKNTKKSLRKGLIEKVLAHHDLRAPA